MNDLIERKAAETAEDRRDSRENRYGGFCVECGQWVRDGAGALIKVEGKWAVRHLVHECPAPIEPGMYAVDTDVVRFYKVEHGTGKWEGYTFVAMQVSDELYPVKGHLRDMVLAAIAKDPRAAAELYGRELGICSRCGRTLTSEWRKKGIGPVCAEKAGWA